MELDLHATIPLLVHKTPHNLAPYQESRVDADRSGDAERRAFATTCGSTACTTSSSTSSSPTPPNCAVCGGVVPGLVVMTIKVVVIKVVVVVRVIRAAELLVA